MGVSRGVEGNFQAQPRVFAHDAKNVTPDDSNDLANTEQRGACIYVGNVTGGSELQVTMEGGTTVIFKGIAAGTFMPILVTRVWATNTTVSDILAIF